MKVIVISDSHGSTNNIIYALSREKDIKTVIFLGDGMDDIQQAELWFPEHKFICVNGNCDSHSLDNTVAYKHIEGTTIVMTHGHRFNAKVSRRNLITHAEGVLAHLVLYGHTHHPEDTVDPLTGIRLVNPGSLYEGRYAVIDFKKGSVDVELKRI